VTASGRYDVLGTRSTPEGEAAIGDTKGVFTPKLGALVHITENVDLYGNVSRGFRQTDSVIEDPTLPLIRAWAYESGVKLDRREFHASFAVFRTDVSNEQTFDPIRLKSTNGGKSRRQGIDADMSARISSAIRITARGTVTDAKYRQLLTAEGDILSGTPVFNTAKFVAAGGVEIAPDSAVWHAGVGANVVGPYTPFDEPGVELKTYALHHLTGGVRIGNAELGLGVRNLLDKQYPEVRAGGFLTPGQPRSVYGTVRYLF